MSHLHAEKSPYLIQHISNPVDWYPWTEVAFQRARDKHRLIFLSIGYSTCHWCHVMAHECFEDQDVAALLNRDFISIKVDREERPDIDQVYMEVCQRLTRRGGWPLSIIMTPDAQPFYAATYIPKHGRQGQPGLIDLLPWVADKWRTDPGYLVRAASDIVAELQRSTVPHPGESLSLKAHVEAEQALKKNFDRRYGGFGRAPKFPRPHDLTFLLQRYAVTGAGDCLAMVEQTLQMMRDGGIYDQLGFGFHRYATDEKWLVPHFEKMLYDQAGLVLPYLEAWQVSGHARYAATAREILTYLLRDMRSPEGAFYSAEDADSEGEEGKFYLWTKSEILALLGSDAEKFCSTYHIEKAGNYHDEMTGKVTGRNILHLSSIHAGAIKEASPDELSESRSVLFTDREKRPRPHLDDKIITAWNGMAISAFARSGRVLGENHYVDCAGIAADFILSTLRGKDGRLLRTYRQGQAAIEAFSEDYAFLARGLLDLYAASFAIERLAEAVEIASLLRQHFQDADTDRLYDTSSGAERLLFRPSSSFDGAIPAATSIALEVFARLFLLTGESDWKAAAEGLLTTLSAEVHRYPAGYTQLLQSADWLLQPGREVVIVGVRGEPETEAMLAAACGSSLRQTVVLFKPEDDAQTLVNLVPFVKQMHPLDGRATAYVCRNFTCHEPTGSAEVLTELLRTSPD